MEHLLQSRATPSRLCPDTGPLAGVLDAKYSETSETIGRLLMDERAVDSSREMDRV